MDTEKYRTGKKRLWAAIVDGIVFMPFLLVDRYLVNPTMSSYITITWLTFAVFVPIFYSIILHNKYGQTIGKWAADIKVLDIDENRNINLSQSFLRDGFYLLLELVGFIYYSSLAIRTGDTQYLLNNFSSFASTPFLIWTILEIVTMLTNSKRRALHDFIAKSVVVRTK